MNGDSPAGAVPLLRVRGLCKYFPIYSRGFVKRRIGLVRAADDVSFDLARGETLGLVGESGSGKTTTGRAILRALRPTRGAALFQVDGRQVDLARVWDSRLKKLRTRMQMIFQDPFSSLNPRMTVSDIVGEPLIIHRMAKGSALEDQVADMLKRVGLKPEHRHRYPHAFSGGQRQRIGIARALIMRPSLVVADEAVSALDVSVQAQIINLLIELRREFHLSYLFIAHDLSVVRHIADRIAVMYAGRIVEMAESESLFADPRHPYTRMLLSAIPNPDPDTPMRFDVRGEAADPGALPRGCAFRPRCPERFAPCESEAPPLFAMPDGRCAACHLYAGQSSEPPKSA